MPWIKSTTTQHPAKISALIQAQYQEFAFQRHYHLDFHIGLITQGQQKFVYKGTSYHAGAGQVVMMPPDELHDGHSKLESDLSSQCLCCLPTMAGRSCRSRQKWSRFELF